jgi:predicted ATPase/class 3 adenylate cyclase
MRLPEGTVTFLFTDIEGSTRLWEQRSEAMRMALIRHDALAADLVAQHAGTLIKSRGEGDSLFAVFANATDAVAAACALQRALVAEPWPTGTMEQADAAFCLHVRMALHTGETLLRDGDYYGSTVNRCARLRTITHGGQIVLSEATYAQIITSLPAGISLQDLGHHRLKDLQQPEHVWQLCHPDLPTDFPPLRSLNPLFHNLPPQMTSFIGREREITEVKRLLADTHLLTLIGSGGCGKTRLALQVAADLLDGSDDGVWLVELAPLTDPALIPQMVAAVLKVSEEPGKPLMQTLVDSLQSKKLLLILDNCEHLLTACARLADTLLRFCPEVTILASSREGLGIAGERTYRVPSLSLPDTRRLSPLEVLEQYEAVRLFTERARFHQPAFAVTQANAQAVTQICLRLDGVPLALELAAARVRALPVEQIATRLDDRFRLLTGGSRTALPRQQTLRALIDWSYDLLTETEQALLARLSVFVGGWTLEAAEEVCQDEAIPGWEVLNLLTQLVDKSLVIYEAQAGQERYHLLETVRQYAQDKLLDSGRGGRVRDRHSDWFLKLAEAADAQLQGPEQELWLRRLETEHPNLRAALNWSRGEVGLRLAGALYKFWYLHGYFTEGRKRLTEVLEQSDTQEHTKVRAHALFAASGLAFLQGDYEIAYSLAANCQAMAQELGEKQELAAALNIMGLVKRSQNDFDAAWPFHEASLALWRELGATTGIASVLGNLGLLAQCQQDYARASQFLEESLAIYQSIGTKSGAAQTLIYLGMVKHFQGQQEQAMTLCQEGLSIARELADGRTIYEAMAILAMIACAQGKMWRAARLSGAVETLMESLKSSIPPSHRDDYEQRIAKARAALGDEIFAAAKREGRALALEQAIAYALEQKGDEG